MSLHKDQDWVKITAETGQTLAGATTKDIDYTKPDGTTGSWDATIVGTTLEYDLVDGDLDQSGIWKFQAHVQFAGSLDGYGDRVLVTVNPR